jgi:hypothetical protein
MTGSNIEKKQQCKFAVGMATPRSSQPSRNWKHEKFARLVAEGTEPAEAYVLANSSVIVQIIID